MIFPKCHFCTHDTPGLRMECFECNMGSNFVLKDRLTAKEQMEWIKLKAAEEIASGKRLVGSIMDGYSYVDTDTANAMQMAANQIIKQSLNNIYGKKKEEKNMKAIDLYNLTRNNGLVTIVAGETSIPVRITDVEHRDFPYACSETTFTCVQVEDYRRRNGKSMTKKRSDLIKNVYFNNPVTVVIWTDGSKTIVKANGNEPYDPEKGLAMAIAKKFMGDNETKSNYYDVFKKWLPKKKPGKIGEINKSRWKIWMTHIDPKTGEVVGHGVYPTDYATKHNAERRAKQLWGDNPSVTWTVSQTNPWETEEK